MSAPSVGVIVVCGPSGAGKTTVGQLLAGALGWRFLDADDLHAPADVARMARGEPLGEVERAPWLARVAAAIEHALDAGEPTVVACSALRAAHRRLLAHDRRVRLVYLALEPDRLAARLAAREGHFAGEAILPGQLATLEEPAADEAVRVDAARPPVTIVADIRRALGV